MLHRGSFDIIKNLFVTKIASDADAKAAFDAATPTDKAKIIAELLADDDSFMAAGFGEAEAAGFVLLYLTRTDSLPTAEAIALRDQLGVPASKPWHKPMPVVSIMALVSQWPDEYAKIPEIAATIPHAALVGSADLADAFIAASVRSVLGLGGLEDVGEKVIGPADPIMAVFIDAVKFQLMTVTAPAWFENGQVLAKLPDSVSPKSSYELNRAVEAEKLRAKAEARRIAAANRRQQMITAYKAKRAAFFSGVVTVDTTVDALVKALLGSTFAELKTVTEPAVWLTEDLKQHAKRYVNIVPKPAQPAPIDANSSKEAKAAHAAALASWKAEIEALVASDIDEDQAIAFVQQYVLSKLAEIKPEWFTELSSGDVVLRRGEPRSSGIDRKTKAIRSGVSRLVHKYGKEKVITQLELFLKDFDSVLITAEEADEPAAEA